MFHRLVNKAICVILLSILGVTSGHAKDISINFIANSTVRITDGEHVLFTDFPYVSGAYDYMQYTYPYFVEQDNDVTTLISNRLTDHFDPEVFLTLGWKIIAPAEVVGDLQKRYLALKEERDRVVADLKRNQEIDQAINPGSVVNITLPDPIIEPKTTVVEENMLIGPMQITAIRTPSAQTEHYSYLVEWGGRKIYFGGDTGDVKHLATLPETDIAFLSPWLFENARKENALPKTKKLVIYHHKDAEIIPNCFNCIVPQKGEYIPFE
ncbi:MAG: MBL fold metallo-hydrolase [Kordiimonadaceae bacterium]|nr:MBL fold metallo-hydrolase [Kordiimonadaceae bacterium]